jgi:hypothetical protein
LPVFKIKKIHERRIGAAQPRPLRGCANVHAPAPPYSKTESRWVNHQTALKGGSVDIYVENKTTLKGAVIASTTDDLKLSTGSFEYSDIKDMNVSYNYGGGANIGASCFSGNKKNEGNNPISPKGENGLNEKRQTTFVTKRDDANKGTNIFSANKKNEGNNPFSLNAEYGFSEKRQTNFATIGNGEITVRNGLSDLTGLKRNVALAQYGTVDVGLKGQMLIDSSTVEMFILIGGAVQKAGHLLFPGEPEFVKVKGVMGDTTLITHSEEVIADGRYAGKTLITDYNQDGTVSDQYVLEKFMKDDQQKQKTLISYIEAYAYFNNGGKKINLHDKNGLNIIMLENYYYDDLGLSDINKEKGNYSSRGVDEFKAQYYIIDNGKIVDTGYGSSHASIAKVKGYKDNSYRDIIPGEYVFSCENPYTNTRFTKSQADEINNTTKGRYFRIFQTENQMNNYNTRLSDNTVLPAEYTGGPNRGQRVTQDYILGHWATRPGSNWNGSLGCQTFQNLDSWSRNNYTLQGWQTLKGKYYLIDRNRPNWKLSK